MASCERGEHLNEIIGQRISTILNRARRERGFLLRAGRRDLVVYIFLRHAMAPIATSDMYGDSQHLGLSAQQKEAFDNDGYLILPNFLSPETTATLLKETRTLLADFSLETHPLTKFTTGENGTSHIGDEYFLESGDKIRFFFEEGAFDSAGTLIKPKEKAINKIGHYLHELSPPFREATLTQQNAGIARDLGFQDPRVLQSMVICKQPEIGGQVQPHQDSTFLYTDPPSAVGFWIALEDATLENGCLSFAKGSHRCTPVKSRLIRMDGGTGFSRTDGALFPDGFRSEPEMVGDAEYTPGEVKAGSLVLIHGNLLHQSEKNLSPKGRIIYTFHVIDGRYHYDEKNWLQPPTEGFSKLYL